MKFFLYKLCTFPAAGMALLFLLGASAEIKAQSWYIGKGNITFSEISFLEENPDTLQIETVLKEYEDGKFTPVKGNFANFGQTKNRYWMHFSAYTNHQGRDLMLEIDNSHIYDLNVYSISNHGTKLLYHTGSDRAFSQRPFPYRNFVFPIHLPPGQETHYFVLLDRRGEVLKLGINIYDTIVYQEHHNLNYWFYGCFTGILVFIMIFNIFLWFTLHDHIHIWYTLYILLILAFVLADNGLGFEFIWNNYPMINKHIRTLTGILAFVVQLHFMQLFISQSRNNSRLYQPVNWNKWFFTALLILSVLPLAFRFNFSEPVSNVFYILFSIAYSMGVLLVGLSLAEKIVQKNRTAMIYLLAIFPLMLQIAVVMLSRWHILSVPVDTTITMSVSILMEVIVLTLGLTVRYNYFKKEKDKLALALVNQQKATMKKVLEAQEDEKRRIAEDLHDDLGGTLSYVKGILSDLTRPQDEKQLQMLFNSQHLLDKACEDLRLIAHDLMPVDFSNTQLSKAIEEAVTKAKVASGIEFSFTSGGIFKDLDKNLELNIFRILSELVHNVRKHSNARNASVQLTYHQDFLQLMVEDDGCGFNPESRQISNPGIGLKNILSRVDYIHAKIYFDSGKQGTTIICNVPYPS